MYTVVLRFPAEQDTMTFRGWSTLENARGWLEKRVRSAGGQVHGWITGDADTVVEEIRSQVDTAK